MSRWVFRKCPEERPPAQWAHELSITPLLLELLWRRGWRSKEDIDNYLSASLKTLTNPECWPQIPEAADLLVAELLAGKKLAVWGDYDVDGITATAMVLEVLEQHGYSPISYLPNRLTDGYGLNIAGIHALAKSGCGILLTVDCGIGNVEAVAAARALGMTVIVSDHHLPPAILPEAHAIVDPRMAGDWPCAHLAGVGVAFYLMGAVNARLAQVTGRRYKMDRALDLAALGTLADVMVLEGENRVLARAGLEHMGRNCRPGLAALKVVSKLDMGGDINCSQALFRLVPRINAAGRMGDPDLALSLLRSDNTKDAERFASELDARNTERKSEEKRIFMEASEQAEQLLSRKNYSALVLSGADWHPGVVGIVASRIVEAFHRPAMILCGGGDLLKGSGRTLGEFDLYAALSDCSRCLAGYGGHRQAAGVLLKSCQLEEFREAFHIAALAALGHEPAEPEILLEGTLDFRQASNHKFLRELELMQPFGPGNEEPVFASPPLLIKRRALLGRTREHVVLDVEDQRSGITLQAKAWRRGGEIRPNMEGSYIRLAYTPRLDTFNGLPHIDLTIRDWRPVQA